METDYLTCQEEIQTVLQDASDVFFISTGLTCHDRQLGECVTKSSSYVDLHGLQIRLFLKNNTIPTNSKGWQLGQWTYTTPNSDTVGIPSRKSLGWSSKHRIFTQEKPNVNTDFF